MKKFEYTQTYIEIAIAGINHTETLNSMGNDGWELISVINMDGRNICYYFKRDILTDLAKKQLLMQREIV